MTHIEDALLYSLAQEGDPYRFGGKAQASNPDPAALDCSGLVKWSCDRALIPDCPHGAFAQWRWTKAAGLDISVADGMDIRGALLFVGDGTGSGRDAITHVAWSLGDGTTIEARGKKWGIGVWPSVGRFDFAGLIPGVDYTIGHGQLLGPDDTREDDEMQLYEIEGSHADKGAAWLVHGNVRFAIPNPAYLEAAVANLGSPKKVSAATWDLIRSVTKQD